MREEEARGGRRDPVLDFRDFLIADGIVDAAAIADIEMGVERAVSEAVAFAAAGPVPGIEEALSGVFAAS
jgi:TPP-dependent pyruvate/acetoin dehydrogenase alpha subunit